MGLIINGDRKGIGFNKGHKCWIEKLKSKAAVAERMNAFMKNLNPFSDGKRRILILHTTTTIDEMKEFRVAIRIKLVRS